MIVIIRSEYTNSCTIRKAYLVETLNKAREFIAKDATCDTLEEVEEWRVPSNEVASKDCIVYDFEGDVTYHVYLKPEEI